MSEVIIPRLRAHPDERFAGSQIAVDLVDVVQRLRKEPQAGEAGHRQETLYHNSNCTIAVFAFDRFTSLPESKTNGIVVMEGLRGTLKISAEGMAHELREGQMLILAPNVLHSVSAQVESEMLLTVHLIKET